MRNFLQKIFKPERRASDTKPRPIEIEKLDPKQAPDREALFQMVVNPQSSEREINAALTKTANLEFIIPWYVESPPRVQTHIADWIARQPGSSRRLAQARGRLKDPRLQRVLDQLSGATPEQASHAPLEQGPDQLERLALRARSAHERREAAGRVEDEPTLQRIARAAKGRDKAVYQIARQKLQRLREESAQIAARQAEVERLIVECEAHARTESTQLYEARFDSLLQRWGQLESAATPEQKERFHAAQAECQVRCNTLAAEARAVAEAESRAQERRDTLKLLQQTLQQLRDSAPDQTPGLSSLDAMQKTQENRWLEATREARVEPREQQEYERLMQDLRAYISGIQAYEANRGQLEAALGEGRPEDLAELLESIPWPRGYSEPQTLAAARARTKARRPSQAQPEPEQRADPSQLEAVLYKLDQQIESRELKASRRLLKEAQQCADRLPEKVRRPLQGRLALQIRQVQDLQDWQGFATRPKQEALCEQMEHLAQQSMDPELKATKIHELQQQWRELGGSSDKELWQRFRQAADLAFAPCQEYFAARNELKAANLHKREQICEELGMFLSQLDWSNCDWRGIEKIHRKAREEWRNAKPIDFRRNRDVQRRFDGLLKQIDSHLDEERSRNEQLKAEIVLRAQALADHEPLEEAISEAKALQKKWQGIGITRQRQDRIQWQSFRAACDRIFARRDSERAELKAQTSEQLTQADTLLDRLEQQLQAEPAAWDTEAIRADLQSLRQFELPPSRREGFVMRQAGLQKRFEQGIRERQLADQKANWLDRLQAPGSRGGDPATLPELCVRAEILAGLDSPPEDQKARMNLQVQRLAAGMGQGQSFPDAAAEMDHLVDLWQANAGSAPDTALADRMRTAIEGLRS